MRTINLLMSFLISAMLVCVSGCNSGGGNASTTSANGRSDVTQQSLVMATTQLVTNENQMTTTTTYDSLPALGADSRGPIVVYTSRTLGTTGYGPGVLSYQRLDGNGAPIGAPVRVSSGSTDDQLNDISGSVIVYTAYDSQSTMSGRIFVYNIATGMSTVLDTATALREARIQGDHAVWLRGAPSAASVMHFDLRNLGTGAAADTIAGPAPTTSDPEIGERFIVWDALSNGQRDVYAYELATGVTFTIAADQGVDEWVPATDGPWVVYEERTAGITNTRILAVNIDTSERRVIVDNGAASYAPTISGNLIAYESRVSGNFDIYVYRIQEGDTFQVTNNASDQRLNNLFGDMVAYVDARTGNLDVFVSKLQFTNPLIANAGPTANTYTNVPVQLNGTAIDPNGNPITEWTWAVESGPTTSSSAYQLSSGNTPTPSFVASVPGDYILSLRVADAYQQSEPSFVTVHVVDNLPPAAVITSDKTSGLVPLTVCFDGSQSTDPEGGPLTYAWVLGDAGAMASIATICHTYQSPGTYTVTLTVTDMLGAADSEVLTITATEPANQPPTASPTATPNMGAAPLKVQFKANAADPDGDLLTYAWTFGDGGTSTEPDPAHTYATAGTFPVVLTVSDGKSSTTAQILVTVSTVSSDLALDITRADINFKNKRSPIADIKLQADLNASIPSARDIIALTIDGATVFSEPFSEFKREHQKNKNKSGIYWLKKKHLWVRIDFMSGTFTMDAEKVFLSGYDASNGVEVGIRIGSDTAVDMIHLHDKRHDRQDAHDK
jgi:PKD repeat protein